MVPKCPHPNSQTPVSLASCMQKGLCKSDQLEDPEIEDCPGWSSLPSPITYMLRRGRRNGQRQRDKCKDGSGNQRRTVLLALDVEEGTTSQGMQEASRSWKGKEISSPLGPLEGKQACSP